MSKHPAPARLLEADEFRASFQRFSHQPVQLERYLERFCDQGRRAYDLAFEGVLKHFATGDKHNSAGDHDNDTDHNGSLVETTFDDQARLLFSYLAAAPKGAELFSILEEAKQSDRQSAVSLLALQALGWLILLSSRDPELHSIGAGLVKILIRDHSRTLYQCLSTVPTSGMDIQTKTPPFLVLWLLGVMCRHGREAAAETLTGFNLGAKSLAALVQKRGRLVEKTPTSTDDSALQRNRLLGIDWYRIHALQSFSAASTAATASGTHLAQGDLDKYLWLAGFGSFQTDSIRELCIRLSLAPLEHRDVALTTKAVQLAAAAEPSPLGMLWKHLKYDPLPTQRFTLCVLDTHLVRLDKLGKLVKLSLFTPALLENLAALYESGEIDKTPKLLLPPTRPILDAVQRPITSIESPTFLDSDSGAAELAAPDKQASARGLHSLLPLLSSTRELCHAFLISACTSAEHGLWLSNAKWQASRVVTAQSAHDAREAHSVSKVSNSNLLKLIQHLPSANEDLLAQRLVVAVVSICPELVLPYLTHVPFSFDPRLSSRWIANIHLVQNILLSTAFPTFDAVVPTDAAYLVDHVVPETVLTRSFLSVGLQHSSPLVRHTVVQLLVALFTKAERVFRFVDSRARALAPSHAASLRAFVRSLHDCLRRRLPDVQIVIALTSQYKPSEKLSAASDSPQLHLALLAGSLKLLASYQRFLKDAFLESRFDVGKLASGDALLKSPPIVQYCILDLLHHAHDFKWQQKSGPSMFAPQQQQQHQLSHFGKLLEIYVSSSTPIIKQKCQQVLISIMHNSGFFGKDAYWADPASLQADDVALVSALNEPGAVFSNPLSFEPFHWLRHLSPNASVIQFLDDSFTALSRDPYQCMELVMDAFQQASSINQQFLEAFASQDGRASTSDLVRYLLLQDDSSKDLSSTAAPTTISPLVAQACISYNRTLLVKAASVSSSIDDALQLAATSQDGSAVPPAASATSAVAEYIHRVLFSVLNEQDSSAPFALLMHSVYLRNFSQKSQQPHNQLADHQSTQSVVAYKFAIPPLNASLALALASKLRGHSSALRFSEHVASVLRQDATAPPPAPAVTVDSLLASLTTRLQDKRQLQAVASSLGRELVTLVSPESVLPRLSSIVHFCADSLQGLFTPLSYWLAFSPVESASLFGLVSLSDPAGPLSPELARLFAALPFSVLIQEAWKAVCSESSPNVKITPTVRSVLLASLRRVDANYYLSAARHLLFLLKSSVTLFSDTASHARLAGFHDLVFGCFQELTSLSRSAAGTRSAERQPILRKRNSAETIARLVLDSNFCKVFFLFGRTPSEDALLAPSVAEFEFLADEITRLVSAFLASTLKSGVDVGSAKHYFSRVVQAAERTLVSYFVQSAESARSTVKRPRLPKSSSSRASQAEPLDHAGQTDAPSLQLLDALLPYFPLAHLRELAEAVLSLPVDQVSLADETSSAKRNVRSTLVRLLQAVLTPATQQGEGAAVALPSRNETLLSNANVVQFVRFIHTFGAPELDELVLQKLRESSAIALPLSPGASVPFSAALVDVALIDCYLPRLTPTRALVLCELLRQSPLHVAHLDELLQGRHHAAVHAALLPADRLALESLEPGSAETFKLTLACCFLRALPNPLNPRHAHILNAWFAFLTASILANPSASAPGEPHQELARLVSELVALAAQFLPDSLLGAGGFVERLCLPVFERAAIWTPLQLVCVDAAFRSLANLRGQPRMSQGLALLWSAGLQCQSSMLGVSAPGLSQPSHCSIVRLTACLLSQTELLRLHFPSPFDFVGFLEQLDKAPLLLACIGKSLERILKHRGAELPFLRLFSALIKLLLHTASGSVPSSELSNSGGDDDQAAAMLGTSPVSPHFPKPSALYALLVETLLDSPVLSAALAARDELIFHELASHQARLAAKDRVLQTRGPSAAARDASSKDNGMDDFDEDIDMDEDDFAHGAHDAHSHDTTVSAPADSNTSESTAVHRNGEAGSSPGGLSLAERTAVAALCVLRELLHLAGGRDCASVAHVPKLLANYSGSQCASDRCTLALLLDYERFGVSISEYALSWGEPALGLGLTLREQSGKSKASGNQSVDLFQTATQRALGRIDSKRMRTAVEHFPTHSPLEHVDPSELRMYWSMVVESSASATFTTHCIRASSPLSALAAFPAVAASSYDPSFMLPVLTNLLFSGGMVDCEKFVHSGSLALLVAALSSHDASMRDAAYLCLGQFMMLLEEELRFRERSQLRVLLLSLRNSITTPGQRLPSVTASFVTHAIHVVCNSGHFLYAALNKFLLLRPQLDLEDVPMFYILFNSASMDSSSAAASLLASQQAAFSLGSSQPRHRRERAWLLHVLLDGVKDAGDLDILHKRHVPELLMSFYDSALSVDRFSRNLVGLVIARLAACARPVAQELVRRNGLLSWLHSHVVQGGYESVLLKAAVAPAPAPAPAIVQAAGPAALSAPSSLLFSTTVGLASASVADLLWAVNTTHQLWSTLCDSTLVADGLWLGEGDITAALRLRALSEQYPSSIAVREFGLIGKALLQRVVSLVVSCTAVSIPASELLLPLFSLLSKIQHAEKYYGASQRKLATQNDARVGESLDEKHRDEGDDPMEVSEHAVRDVVRNLSPRSELFYLGPSELTAMVLLWSLSAKGDVFSRFVSSGWKSICLRALKASSLPFASMEGLDVHAPALSSLSAKQEELLACMLQYVIVNSVSSESDERHQALVPVVLFAVFHWQRRLEAGHRGLSLAERNALVKSLHWVGSVFQAQPRLAQHVAASGSGEARAIVHGLLGLHSAIRSSAPSAEILAPLSVLNWALAFLYAARFSGDSLGDMRKTTAALDAQAHSTATSLLGHTPAHFPAALLDDALLLFDSGLEIDLDKQLTAHVLSASPMQSSSSGAPCKSCSLLKRVLWVQLSLSVAFQQVWLTSSASSQIEAWMNQSVSANWICLRCKEGLLDD